MARFGVQLRVLGLQGEEGGCSGVVAADGGAEARLEGFEDGVVGCHGEGCGVVEEMGWLLVAGLGGN